MLQFPKKTTFATYKKVTNTFTKPPMLNIITVYQDLLAPLGQVRRKMQVPCFYHDDTKPSMTLYTDSNTFFCFTCRKWGSSYQIIMDIKHMNFRDALNFGKRNYL